MFDVREAPVDVELIARGLEAGVVYRPFEGDVSGMVYRNRREKVIGVNSSHPQNRQRFTVAHEIGHLVLHKGQPVFVDSFEGRINWRDGASAKEESEANAFAAELLMPRALVLGEVDRAVGEEDLSAATLTERMARDFKVSQQSMRYRLENLGVLDPGGLLE
ncbi:MAG TPA: ImmA/IrrE family metallo-endopeptidase [Isosphaeraceae bacterium]|nr:ImmA/IrrE family metallo-endopeptidase [Isosphaeraceae bacterium]